MRTILALVTAASLATSQPTYAQARFELPRDTGLTDEPVRIVLRGAPPSALVTIRLGVARQRAYATFISDRSGTVDLGRDEPVIGTYSGADAMGLFWSARIEGEGQGAAPAIPPMRAMGNRVTPIPFALAAEVNGAAIASDTMWRRPVAAGVKITELRDAGFTATLYEPPDAGRHPAIVMLAGSQGGRFAPVNYPGGFASRGYVVLALAYFRDEGLPPQISNLPLEYFETAINWLRARPSVDSARIGLLGGSKGAESVLLIASHYPQLVRAVAALVPGSVTWNGCCDSIAALGPSFTRGGVPLPHMPPPTALGSELTALSRDGAVRAAPLFMHRLADTAAVAKAAIPVERIRGAVLLISPAATERARERAWNALLEFFATNLR